MNLRCAYCQTPFTMNRGQLLTALKTSQADNLHHYDVHCPKCRKANQVPRDRMERAYPNWREALAAETPAETTDQKAE